MAYWQLSPAGNLLIFSKHYQGLRTSQFLITACVLNFLVMKNCNASLLSISPKNVDQDSVSMTFYSMIEF